MMESDNAMQRMSWRATVAATEFKDRAAEAVRVEQMFGGVIYEHVKARLRASFNEQTYQEMHVESGIADYLNIARDVEDRACTEWNDGATYSLLNGNVPVDGVDALRFDRVMNVLNYDVLGLTLARGIFRHPGMFVVPTVLDDPNTGKRVFRHVVGTPADFNLVPHQQYPALYVQMDLYWWHEDETGARRRCKRSWTSEEYRDFVLRDERWDPMGPAIPNPYGRIPGRFYRREPCLTRLWADAYGSMLADVTIEANAAETLINYQARTQIKVLGGEFEAFPSGQVLAQARAINYGKGENFNVLDFQTDLVGLDEVTVNRKRRRALVSCGLPGDELDGGGGANESGAARRARYEDRDRLAKARRRLLVAGLQEQYWLDLMVLHYALREGGPPIEGIGATVADLAPYATLDEKREDGTLVASAPIPLAEQPYRFVVNPRERQYRLTQDETEKEALFALEHGLKTDADLYRELIDPDATEEEAANIVRRNKQINATQRNQPAMALGAMFQRKTEKPGG